MKPKYIPECDGGFHSPSRIKVTDITSKDGCPWCGHTAKYDLE